MKTNLFARRLLALGLVPMLGVGCASARSHVSIPAQKTRSTNPVVAVEQGIPFSEMVAAGEQTRLPARPSVAEPDSKSEIQVVNFQPEITVENQQLSEPAKLPPVPDEQTISSTDPGMTLQALEDLAMQNNPAIQQANAVASKASGVHYQVGLKPNPSIGYFGEEIGNEGAGGLQGAFVSQTFVRGDKLAWNRQVIGHDVESMRWQVETQRQRVRTDIQVQFYQALAAQKRLELARDFRVIMERGVQVSKDRVAAQVGTRPDVLQSEIQLNEVELVIQQAEFQYDAAWKQLVALAGVPDLPPRVLIGEFQSAQESRDAETIYNEIVAKSPLLSAAYARVQRTQANLQRQNVQAIPNVNAQFGVGRDDGTGDTFANIQLSLPIPFNNHNEGNISAAHAEYCEATQNVQRIKMQIRQNLADTMREYQIANSKVTRYESAILPKAQETLELVQEAQEAGEFDFLRVLTARRTYFDANLNYVTSLSDLSSADARIEGLLLTGGLSNVVSYDGDDSLRDQALSGQ
ncbi:TolC family protein [Thalassoglobus sp.]|uniref:TolC family protein n=1 Tax=Thalassoglobus sp. TaxID=2795869 RepID=UPI003AA8849A